MRKVIITLCFLFVAFVAQAGRISGINIQSSGEAILVFVDGEQNLHSDGDLFHC